MIQAREKTSLTSCLLSHHCIEIGLVYDGIELASNLK